MPARSAPKKTTSPLLGDTSPDYSSASELARYIEDITGQLQQLAQREKLDFLAYLLDLARIEAGECAVEPDFGEAE